MHSQGSYFQKCKWLVKDSPTQKQSGWICPQNTPSSTQTQIKLTWFLGGLELRFFTDMRQGGQKGISETVSRGKGAEERQEVTAAEQQGEVPSETFL